MYPLEKCIENELYGSSKKWSVSTILKKIKKLQNYILWDYIINGSFTVFNDEIWWDLEVNIIKPKELFQLFSMLEI